MTQRPGILRESAVYNMVMCPRQGAVSFRGKWKCNTSTD